MEEAIKLRSLTSADIFSMSRIIGKIGLKNFKKCFESDELKKAVAGLTAEERENEENLNALGMLAAIDVADVLFEHLPDCEKELYSFLADLSGLKVQDVKNLPMATFFELIVGVIKKPEFKDFFKVASKLFK